jgi:Transposase DDE domain
VVVDLGGGIVCYGVGCDFCKVFLKVVFKTNKETGKRAMHYRMVESYRIDNTVRHISILHLGTLDQLPEASQKKALGRRIDEIIKEKITRCESLYTCEDPLVESLAQGFAKEIIEKQKIDISGDIDYQLIDTEGVKHEEVKEIGGEWLCMQALAQLKLGEILAANGFNEAQIQLAYTHIISRAVHPASELATSKWIKQNSGVCTLTEYPVANMTKDKLYAMSHKLYSVKEQIEKQLGQVTNELFDIEDKIMIYDLTNTYFEGRMVNSKIAAFGRSKEKRNDAKLIVLALVVNVEGFIKYSHIFEGNMSDSNSLPKIITELSNRTSHLARKPIVVIDAGIASEDNLTLLAAKGYQYMCVSRSGMTKYTVDTNSTPVRIQDKQEQPITLQKVSVDKITDTFIKVCSQAKKAKEQSMNEQFKKRFETALTQIKEALGKKKGVKKVDKVWERIGRAKQKYASIAKYYAIEVKADGQGIATELNYKIIVEPTSEGEYLLRTNIEKLDEKAHWLIYNTIREVESTFRTLKTDLDLRPIYHKRDDASMAHLHLGLLAYWVVHTIRYQLKQKGIHHDWKEIQRLMLTQKLVTTQMKGPHQITQLIKCSEPIKEVTAIYEALGYKTKPFTRKKSVVLTTELKKTDLQYLSNSPPI